jgi:chromosome segregation ATPase
MESTIVIAAIGLIGSLSAGYRATTDANRVNEKKVDAEAYARSQGFYEKLLTEADKHLDRLRNQVTTVSEQLARVTEQLGEEQEVSDHLRTQLRGLQEKVVTMETALITMRVDLSAIDVRAGKFPTLKPGESLPQSPPETLTPPTEPAA